MLAVAHPERKAHDHEDHLHRADEDIDDSGAPAAEADANYHIDAEDPGVLLTHSYQHFLVHKDELHWKELDYLPAPSDPGLPDSNCRDLQDDTWSKFEEPPQVLANVLEISQASIHCSTHPLNASEHRDRYAEDVRPCLRGVGKAVEDNC